MMYWEIEVVGELGVGVRDLDTAMNKNTEVQDRKGKKEREEEYHFISSQTKPNEI